MINNKFNKFFPNKIKIPIRITHINSHLIFSFPYKNLIVKLKMDI
jgi:hypothetical protein